VENKDPVFIKESTKLSGIVGLMADAKIALEKLMEELGAFNVQKLKEMRENPATNPMDFQQFLNMLDTKNTVMNVPDKYKRLDELTYLQKEPYFSRIDLVDPDTNKVEQHYIGKFGFTEDKTPIVLDWRTKVASVFYKYRFPQKDVSYTTPEGVVTTDLLLKRTFEIDNGELVKYYNNDIKLDESEIIVDKIEGRTGGVLEDIIETIQENQHEIIESDPRRVCIVQGTVGSGKSTVAIHKLSYLFFNYPKLIRPERSILIAKNQILVGYLSTLFPKLGIFDINYGTIRDVIFNLIYKEKMNIEFDLSRNTSGLNFSKSELEDIAQQIQDVHDKYKDEISEIFGTEETEPFGGFVYDPKQAVVSNLTESIKDLEQEIKYQKEFVKEHSNHERSKLYSTNIKIMRKIVRKLSSLRAQVKARDLKRFTTELKLLKDGVYGYKEALIYTIIYSELIGFSAYQKFDYCVVDEGQDLSLLEYTVLNKLVQNGRFCILGDLNQSYAEEGLSQWEDIFDVVDSANDAQKYTLDTNYRSTKPIIDFANKILSPHTKKYLPISINRVGSEPKVVKHDSFNDVVSDFTKEITEDVKNLEKSVGIICMNEDIYDQIDEIISNLDLPHEKYIKLRETDRVAYLPRAVYLTHFDNCKGLEFGKVYVLGLDPTGVKDFTQAKKAFVAVTRAMDELCVYSYN
jgi:DNA helicase II / ATP-dependent DNA helicase PcrA